MKNILAAANRSVLARFARSRVLLAFDFDGTLAPIVSDPARAAMRATTRALLRRLAARYPCVVISGRARADALRRVEGTGAVEVIGNHGIEPGHASSERRTAVKRWQPILARRLGGLAGVSVEDKLYSLTVHYRRSPDPARARAEIGRAASKLGDARVVGGKRAVNLVPTGAPDKGTALERARSRFECDTAVYVGDDETDEDVFALGRPERLLAVRVGRKNASRASYFIQGQADIDRFLLALLDIRPVAPPATTPSGARRRAVGPP